MTKKRTSDDIIKKLTSPLERNATIRAVCTNDQRADDETAAYRFELSYSSEEPYERWFGVEILGHEPEEVDLKWLASGNAALLNQHKPDEQIGVIESAKLEDGRGKAVVRFGKSVLAQEIRQDVIDGIRSNVSVGYHIHAMVLEEQSDEEPDRYRVTRWSPVEISIVSMPADQTVGLGRNAEPGECPPEKNNHPKLEYNMTLKERALKMGLREDASEEAVLAAEREAYIAQGKKDSDAAHAAELKRQSEIRTMGKEHNLTDDAEKAIEDHHSAETFRAAVLDKYTKGFRPVASAATVDTDERNMFSKFSLRKFLLGTLEGASLTGAEAEVQSEGQREANRLSLEVGPGYLPSRAMATLARTATGQNAGTDAKGKYLVETSNIGLIEALRPRLWMDRLGVTMLSGLVNNITLPALDDEGDAEDRNETQELTLEDTTFAQRTLTPSRVGARRRFSLQLLRQSSPQIDGVLANIILSAIAKRYNEKGIAFLIALSNTGSVVTDGAPLSHDVMRAFLTSLKTDNADEAPGAFLINPETEGVLATTKVDAGSGLFLYSENGQGEGRVLNRRSLTTSLMPNDHGVSDHSVIAYGNYSKLWMGDWGGVDIVRDIYTRAAFGQIEIVANSFIGFAAEHPEFFVLAKDVDLDAVASA